MRCDSHWAIRDREWIGEVREIFSFTVESRKRRASTLCLTITSHCPHRTHMESVFHRTLYFTSCAGKQKQMTKDDERRRRKNGICKTQKKCRDSFERITLWNLCVFCSCSNCGSCRHHRHRRHYRNTTDDNMPTPTTIKIREREIENRTGAAIYDKKTHNRTAHLV